MTIPDTDLARVRRFCERRTPPELRDRMRLEISTRGNSVTISDCEPLFQGAAGEWINSPIAQLRYDPASRHWALYWADSNDRWHRYDDLDPTPDIDVLISEIDEDPTCIFFG